MLLLLIFLETLILTILIFLIPLMFYFKKKEILPIESGFQSISKTSMKSFSINFFYILIIFIIFDLELILIFSFLENINLMFLLFFMFFIYFTLILEWNFNKIKWLN